MQKTRNTLSQLLSGSLRLLGNTFTSLADICGDLRQSRIGELPVDPDTLDELTFVDAMRWLTENKPETASVCRAALLRESDSRGQKISFVYLDVRDQLITSSSNFPVGKAVIARRLDRELSEYFADELSSSLHSKPLIVGTCICNAQPGLWKHSLLTNQRKFKCLE